MAVGKWNAGCPWKVPTSPAEGPGSCLTRRSLNVPTSPAESPRPPRSHGREPNPVHGGVRGNEEGGAVLTPRDVPDVSAEVEPAEHRPVRRKDVDTARPGAENIPPGVHLEAIRGPPALG